VNTWDTRLLFRALLSILETVNGSLTVRQELMRRLERLKPVPVPPVGADVGGGPGDG
jgi:hypothetical protein